MEKYKLKKGQEKFAVVDGILAGRSYVPGREYGKNEIPAGDLKRFEQVKSAAPPVAAESAKTTGKGVKKS